MDKAIGVYTGTFREAMKGYHKDRIERDVVYKRDVHNHMAAVRRAKIAAARAKELAIAAAAEKAVVSE